MTRLPELKTTPSQIVAFAADPCLSLSSAVARKLSLGGGGT